MDNFVNDIILKLKNVDITNINDYSIKSLKSSFDEFLSEHSDSYNSDFLSKEIEAAYEIVENSKVIIFDWTVDVDAPVRFVSKNIVQFGYTPEDFYSGELKNYWNFVHPDDIEKVKKDIYKARKSKLSDYKHIYRVKTKSGEVRWVEERIIFERDRNQELINEKGIIIDVTETKKLQDELKKSEERYKRIFENSSVMIITVKLDGTIITINKKFSKTLGYNEDYILGKKIHSLIDKNYLENKNMTIESLIKKVRENSEESVDAGIICKNGEIKILNISATLIDSFEEEMEIVAVDVSEKVKIENKIRYLSFHDKLTDVYNRAYYDEMLHKFENEKNYPFSIIIGDMNGLKDVNDNLGHKEGDELLKKMANIFVKSSRERDIICRIGGDEFAIICPDTNEVGARKICTRIRNRCEDYSDNKVIKPSVALGYATKHSDEDNLDVIMKLADDNMYKNKLNASKSSRGLFIKTMQLMLEEKTSETNEHSLKIKDLSIEFASKLELGDDVVDDLTLVALLHDIGKIGVPDSILNKPGTLTKDEYEIVKNHSYIGYNILRNVSTTESVAEYILHHHERFDGNGYPDGLQGMDIPLISRIITIVDAYVVMTSEKTYKKIMTHEEAVEELILCSGTQFDAELVKVFINIR